MKFDLQEYRAKIIENKGIKSEVLLKYESIYGLLPHTIEECNFYTEYVSKFEHNIEFLVPEKSENNFNWNLFLKLMAASFPNTLSFEITHNGNINAIITLVTSQEIYIKKISELNDDQIVKNYTVFVNEQIKNFVTKNVDQTNYNFIIEKQQKALLQFQNELLPKLEHDLKVFEIMQKYRNKQINI